jgi:hypothetical protein
LGAKRRVALSYEEQEYHRRRSEAELESAISAADSDSAVAHLELARMHRARRLMNGKRSWTGPVPRAPVLRIDKEG